MVRVSLSKRKREETLTGQTDCKFAVRVWWKDQGKRGFGSKAFIFTVDTLVYRLARQGPSPARVIRVAGEML